MAGEFFESFVISEIIKGYYNKGVLDPPFYFYRDKDKKEIDVLIEENSTLYPLEVKNTLILKRVILPILMYSIRFECQSGSRRSDMSV